MKVTKDLLGLSLDRGWAYIQSLYGVPYTNFVLNVIWKSAVHKYSDFFFYLYLCESATRLVSSLGPSVSLMSFFFLLLNTYAYEQVDKHLLLSET